MNVAMLLITHEHIADNLLSTVHNILNDTIDNIATIEVPMDAPTEIITTEAEKQLSNLKTGDGLLVITDLVGSTPFNVATLIKTERKNAILISGINLPMLLKLFNYRNLPLVELADKALNGGQTGIDKHEQ